MQNLKLQNRSGGHSPQWSLSQAPKSPSSTQDSFLRALCRAQSETPGLLGLVALELKQTDQLGSYLRPLEGVAGL